MVRVRAMVTTAGRRAVESLPAALQIMVAVVASYSIAHYGLGHAAPIIAVTVTITSLGIARDARPRRVLEIAIGVTIGILTSELIGLALGKGTWQMAIVLFATLIVARAVSANPAFAVAAATQSMIVLLLPDPQGGPFTRSVDALIAGLVALAVTALIPRDPRRAAARDARALFSVFGEALEGIVDALANGNHPAAELALERLRRTQTLVDNWATSLESAIAIARISPWLRRHLPELLQHKRVLAGADLTSRHLRVIARRVTVVVADGRPHPELAGLVGEMAADIALFGHELDDRSIVGASKTAFIDLARRLDPEAITPDAELRETMIVVLVRPLVVDLLVSTGMPVDDARALLPVV
jgi:uncharacterized membrane protein YgaE (UPF0421/DUF939 family)